MELNSTYLASPVDQSARWDEPGGQVVLWLDRMAQIKDQLSKQVGFVFDPATLIYGGNPNAGLFTILESAIVSCDLFLAVLPAGVPTLGVPTEIEYAMGLDKPIILLTDLDGVSWVVEKWKRRYPRIYVTNMYENLDPALEWASALNEVKPMIGISGSWGNTQFWTDELVKTEDDLKWVALDLNAVAPRRNYNDDAGFDLTIIEDAVVPPGQTVRLSTGVAVQLPSWSWGMITGRSSTWARGLLCPVSVIDAGWRGELLVSVHNLGSQPHQVRSGDRLAQLIILDNGSEQIGKVVEVDQLDPHDRGTNGFGSSGR